MVANYHPDAEQVVAPVAAELAKRYRNVPLEAQDLAQELRLWCLSHEERVSEFLDREEAKEFRRGLAALRTTLYRVGDRYCRREKARIHGYETRDEAFYDLETIRELLPAALDAAHQPPDIPDEVDTGKSNSDPAYGGTTLVMAIDVAKCLAGLEDQDRILLTYLYEEGTTPLQDRRKAYVKAMDLTPQGGAYREAQAIKRLGTLLGGRSPY